MALPIASKTLRQIRESIGFYLGKIIVSVTSCSVDAYSLISTYGLAKGGTDDYKGRQVLMVSGTTANQGQKSFVSSFDSTNKDATITPGFTSAIAVADGYELWEDFTTEQVLDVINQAIVGASDDILVDKIDTTLTKQNDIYEYTIPSGFVALHTVEYEYDTGIEHLLADCETAFTGGTSVTATADSSFKKIGNYSAKFVVAVGAASGATLCYKDISAVDISDCDKVDFWMYSSITLTAGQLQFMLGATAAIASPLETIDIPAMTAGTWYHHSLSLANPASDTAIISIGIRQASGVDVGAFTFYLDDVNTVLNNSRIYKMLNPDMWNIVNSKVKLSTNSGIDNNSLLRLSGYRIPIELSADADVCEIDPEYVVYYATAQLLMSKINTEDTLSRVTYFKQFAERRLVQARTSLPMNTRWMA